MVATTGIFSRRLLDALGGLYSWYYILFIYLFRQLNTLLSWLPPPILSLYHISVGEPEPIMLWLISHTSMTIWLRTPCLHLQVIVYPILLYLFLDKYLPMQPDVHNSWGEFSQEKFLLHLSTAILILLGSQHVFIKYVGIVCVICSDKY